MARTMFANQDRLTTDDLCQHARDLGLDMDRFAEDLRSPAVVRRVEDDMLDAELMDLHSTPTFFIGERRHKGRTTRRRSSPPSRPAANSTSEEAREARKAREAAKARAVREPGDA